MRTVPLAFTDAHTWVHCPTSNMFGAVQVSRAFCRVPLYPNPKHSPADAPVAFGFALVVYMRWCACASIHRQQKIYTQYSWLRNWHCQHNICYYFRCDVSPRHTATLHRVVHTPWPRANVNPPSRIPFVLPVYMQHRANSTMNMDRRWLKCLLQSKICFRTDDLRARMHAHGLMRQTYLVA